MTNPTASGLLNCMEKVGSPFIGDAYLLCWNRSLVEEVSSWNLNIGLENLRAFKKFAYAVQKKLLGTVAISCFFPTPSPLFDLWQDKGRPLPKFGEWDVNDPSSAEGFTVIFNKARDEKKTGGKPDSPAKNQPNSKPGMDSTKSQPGLNSVITR
ncbi:hypothetical protein Cgig2_028007 [Carnegiea gigantea]|uniref:RIN4 pathogenic type III effector avirulence factor Avr cleavage site domain-containing protein n=1 Tax=Carnegiea gigantea TaxID=171969 RepID=A0A9Q1JJL8_9CARY|nr:hypothetical protein Cgig2_028007 [Carnegiea gigantea]